MTKSIPRLNPLISLLHFATYHNILSLTVTFPQNKLVLIPCVDVCKEYLKILHSVDLSSCQLCMLCQVSGDQTPFFSNLNAKTARVENPIQVLQYRYTY